MNNPVHNDNWTTRCGILVLGFMLASIPLSACAGPGWQFSSIDERDFMTRYDGSQIRLDSGGNARVLQVNNFGLSYAYLVGETWKRSSIEQGCLPKGTHYVLDNADVPHVLYSALNTKIQGLKYAHAAGSIWDVSLVYSKPSPSEEEMSRRFGGTRRSLNSMVADSNDLAIDNSGGVHLVYVDPETERLVYEYRAPHTQRVERESLEHVGGHRLSAGRIAPSICVAPTGDIWIFYKKYTLIKTSYGENATQYEHRLAVNTGGEWTYYGVEDGGEFVYGYSQLMFAEAGKGLITLARSVQLYPGDPPFTRWFLYEVTGGDCIQRFEGAPGERILGAAWVDGRFQMLVVRVQFESDAYRGRMRQDALARLSEDANGNWSTRRVLSLHNRRALDAAISRFGEIHILVQSHSSSSSVLEHGVLKMNTQVRQQDAAADLAGSAAEQ